MSFPSARPHLSCARYLSEQPPVQLVRSVVAIGDAPNDIDMLQAAGLGVAVENAHPDVLAAEDYIAPECDRGAVAHTIRKFLW